MSPFNAGRDRQGNSKRHLRVEALEARRVLAAAIGEAFAGWQPVRSEAVDPGAGTSYVRALDYELFELDHNDLVEHLADAPLEFVTPNSEMPLLSIPRPDGELETFRFVSSPIMAPELAERFPEIQTFAGVSTENSATRVRFDFTPHGFHAMVMSPEGSYYVDPYFHLSDSQLYASYFAAGEFDVSDLGEVRLHDFEGDWYGDQDDERYDRSHAGLVGRDPVGRTGEQLRVYRTAVAATGEYTAFHGGTVASAQAAIVTAMNRVNGIYENELTIRMELVADNSFVVYTDPNTDPFTNNNAGALLGESQATLDSIIGNANYDVGHVFSTGAGGLARLGSVGIDPIKAQGATGLPSPIGDPFYVDYVAHELGHQFGGNHTFNGDSGACGGNANLATAMEPGSGSTIQAYAGICGNDDIQQNSDAYFHSVSFDEMIAHVDNVIPGVGQRLNTGNATPSVSAGDDYVIPARTPFVLTAAGFDEDVDNTLTFNWEQRDTGPQQDVNAGDNGASPIFRSFTATESPSRYFPRLPDLLAGTTVIGETLPTTNRFLNFRATVRDNNIGGGGVATDDMRIQVVDTGAPFQVTSHDAGATLMGLTQETISWDVAGTDAAPINATEVTVLLSIDGGLTYPFVVADGLPNTGSADIIVPNVSTTTGRFMVRGQDNVFFDINDADLVVEAAPVEFDLGAETSTFTENQAPVSIAPAATIQNPSAFSLENLSVSVDFGTGYRFGDQIEIASVPGGIEVIGSSVAFSGFEVGTLTQSGNATTVVLNASATDEALAELIRSFSFLHNGDNPGAQDRIIDFTFGGAFTLSQPVSVVPTNDSPTIANVALPAILEDSLSIQGTQISELVGTAFDDVDVPSSLSGIAIVNATENLSQGQWYFSTDNGTTWVAVGDVVTLPESIVLAASHHLGFLPAADYFGMPSPLVIRALDDTYDGAFSNSGSGTKAPLTPTYLAPDASASSNTGEVAIMVTNVNDPPAPTSSLLSIDLSQDEAIDRILDEGLFLDKDSAGLTWTMTAANGTGLPQWLSFEPTSRSLTGTPLNRDVGNYELRLTATDEFQASASIPVFVSVANVNDAPVSLRLSGDTIAENRSNAVVGELFATDPDTGDLIRWSVDDPRFEIRENLLLVREGLDFESAQSINLRLTASDNGTPVASSVLDAEIEVIDVNEFFPSVEGGDVFIRDGAPAGTLVADLDAVDGDIFDTVGYRLAGGDTGAFTIDGVTGELRLAEDAAFSRKPSYRVFVESFDDGSPSKSRTVQFDVMVEPVNDFPPSIESPQMFTIAENPAPGTSIGFVVASDRDGDEVSFELLTETEQVSIDPQTGEITTTESTVFDFEVAQTVSLLVRVTESASPNRTATGVVNIAITDANDPPSGIQLENEQVPTSRMGYALGSLTVSDPDSVGSSYFIATDDPRFEISGGELSLSPDFHFTDQDLGQQEIQVQVTDLGNGAEVTLPLSFEVFSAPAWTNLENAADVSGDGIVAPLDALLLVTEINSTGGGRLSDPRSLEEQGLPDFDPSGDGFLSPIDVLIVTNAVNQGESEGEELGAVLEPSVADQAWHLAFLEFELEERRKRF